MVKNTLIQVRVEESLKREADALFSDLGLDTPTAIRIFLKQAVKQHGIPFEVAQPAPAGEGHGHTPNQTGRMGETAAGLFAGYGDANK